jgi:hypothetical protein
MKASEIVTGLIALYGAGLSTVAIVRQFAADRVKVRVTVQRNMRVFGNHRYAGQTLTVVTVINVGRRPVTITSLGAIGLHPYDNLAIMDSQPMLPCEITEGKYIKSLFAQADLDFSKIDYWSARDSTDKEYILRQAPLWRHWKSVIQARLAFKKKNRTKAATSGGQ